MEQIFSNLRLEGTGQEDLDSEDSISKRLDRLLADMQGKRAEAAEKESIAGQSRLEAEEKKKKAEQIAEKLGAEAADAQARARKAEEERQKAEQAAATRQREADVSALTLAHIGAQDIIEELKNSPEIRDLLQKDLPALGLTQEQMKTIQGARDAIKEASDAGSLLTEGITIIAGDKRRWWLLAWVLAVPAVTLTLVLLAQWQWLQPIAGVVSAMGAVLGTAVGVWQRYSPKLKPILNTAAKLKEKRALLERRVQEAREKQIARAVQLDEEVRRKREEAAAATKQAEDMAAQVAVAQQEAQDKQKQADSAAIEAQTARTEVERMKQAAEALRPERRIAAFIQDRAAARDYRRHLGVPAIIRRDFEKLAQMFHTRRGEEEQGKDQNDLTIVNRIILYIDDLDRCPPAKVVDVLRAIHLLLAFPLFVVIVAVDARWVKRSLRDRFSLMWTSPREEIGKVGVRPNDEELVLGSMATPDDYLEKVFQVPFWIRPLNRRACRNLVNALTEGDTESQSSTPEIGDGPELTRTTRGGQTEQPGAPGTTPAPVPAKGLDPSEQEKRTEKKGDKAPAVSATQWSPVKPKPRTLHLTREEREYMLDLAPVIGRSPRCVKRFVNCYRLLKSALDQDELARVTRDGTFRTTMLLLGLVTGFPDIAPALLTNLREAEEDKPLEAWATEAAEGLTLSKRQRWEEALSVIKQLKKESKIETIRPLAHAAELVDRFTFSPAQAALSGGR